MFCTLRKLITPLALLLTTTLQAQTTAFEPYKTDEFFYQINKVNRVNPDSAIVTVSYGKKDGLFMGAAGNIMTSHNAGAKSGRENVAYIGNATIIDITDTSATASVKIYKKNAGVELLPKDLLAIEVHPVTGLDADRDFFHSLARKDILFLDNNRKEIKTKRQQLLNANPGFTKALLKDYAQEIRDFYPLLKDFLDSSFLAPYTKGPYKGRNMYDVFKDADEYDLRSFFHFVNKFPGKYMGGTWKINETFATWVLNNAPPGGNEREWVIPALMAMPEKDIPAFVQKHRFFIESDTLSIWGSQIWDLQSGHKEEAAFSLCNKLLQVAQLLKDKNAENEFYYTRSQLLDAGGKTKEGLADALRVYEADKTNINYLYNLGNMYGKLEDFDKCFTLYDEMMKLLPGNETIMGNYGWYKITAGQIDDAIPLCKAAYERNPGNVAYAVNYGHTFLLKGNTDSARYYYQKTLENISTPTDYTVGPRTDFDLFFKKGWNRKGAAEMADWMDKEFNEKYYAVTNGNDLWNEAKKNYNDKNYPQAVSKWREYIAGYNASREPNALYIHNAFTWIGSSYDKFKNHDSAFVYYDSARKIAQNVLVHERNLNTTKSNDHLVNDYERLYNHFLTSGNIAEAERYKMLYDAEAEKVTELFANPALHLIVLSAEGAARNKKSATAFYENFAQLRKENKEGYKIQVSGASLNRDKLMAIIEEARRKSKPEDIFVFYYAGAIQTDNTGSYIRFNEKDTLNGSISITELMDNLDFVYAHKKMIITDQPSAPLLSLVTSRYINAGRNASEVIYLSPGTETPVQENGASLFTTQLVSTLNELKQNEKFSAKDFVDKASFTLGRGQYYFPVLSFSFGKDFLLYETTATATGDSLTITRGLKPTAQAPRDADAVTGPQKNYALLFATDIYKDAGFDKLSNPIYDASTMARLLQEDFGFEVTLVKNPTLDEIESALSRFRDEKNYGSNDQLFIFFAGHGLYDERSKMGYLVATDSKVNDPNYKTYLSYSDLGNKYLKNISCNRIFLTLDACFAGSFFDNNTVRGTIQEANAKNLAALQRMASNQHFYKGISSGAKQYVEDGKPGQHSPFASKFLSTLWNKAMNKSFVTADEIIAEIKSNPPGATAICEGNFHYSDPFSHFIFELKDTQKKPDIKTKVLN